MARRDISMQPSEVDAFLQRCDVMAVGTIDADGWPNATLARCEFTTGELTVWLSGDDAVAAGAYSSGQVCCVADEHPSYYEIRGVILDGRPMFTDGGIRVDIQRTTSFDFSRLPQ